MTHERFAQITEKLLESPNDQFDDDEYAHLIDCHVDSARDDEAHSETEEDEPIWKRRNSVQYALRSQFGRRVTTNELKCREQRPVRPLNLAEDSTDLELVSTALARFSASTCNANLLRQKFALASTANIHGGESLWWRLQSSTSSIL